MDSTLKIPQRPLGSTGLNVSVLGLGTVKFGRNQKIKYPTFELPTDKAICQLLDDAKAYGINLLDTAPAYGIAEERLGELLGTRRNEFVVITKCGEEFVNGESNYNFSAEHTRLSVERSLKRLKANRLDCVLVHCPRNDLEVLEKSPVLETLRAIKDRGDIRSFGASVNSIEGGMLALDLTDVVMVTYSAEDKAAAPVIRRAAELRKGVLIKKGLGSGTLTGGGTRSLEEMLWPIFSVAGISSLIVGTLSPDHLRANVRAVAALV
ncbi:MAG TPA: aldo/keto reductase [Verrucomicrobiae bacterium]|jgi:aryl-alcohol dehydrogenase-like predicted oxidoreductase